MNTPPRWATRKEAAKYARTSEATLDRWLTAGHVTRYGAGRHIRIDRADGFEIRCFLRRRREDEHENTGHRHKKRPKSRIFPGP